jgi:uncharacterized membrane protein YdjX (TVP38/TMEM64 family)
MTKTDLLKILIFPACIAVMIALWAAGLKDYMSLEYIQASGADLQSIIDAHFIPGALVYMACYIAVVVSCLPAVALVTLVGGFLFGLAWGFVFVMIGATAGAALLFLLARSSFGGIFREKAGDFYNKVEKQMQQGAVSYMLFMRLVPGMPSFVANIVPALFGVPLRLFVLTTMIGILPGAIILVNLGQALGRVNSLSDLFSPQVLLALSLLALCALLPVMAKKIRTALRKALHFFR